jgi:segregation and condensation protein A
VAPDFVFDPASIRITDFSSPLELLDFLLVESGTDLSGLMISPIIEAYLDLMQGLDEVDMDLASAFLVLAATLLSIKSAKWLPGKTDDSDEGSRLLFDLELSLLAYRRCRLMAEQLKSRHTVYANTGYRLPLAPADVGVTEVQITDLIDEEKFARAVAAVEKRNLQRFQDLRRKVRYLLRRETVSVKETMYTIMQVLDEKKEADFSTMFPPALSVPKRVAGFLAVLELLRLHRISVRQERAFGPIELKLKPEVIHAE